MTSNVNTSQPSLADEIMTLAEIAKYLKVSEKTITRMLHSGSIPGTKVASQWRFVRAAVDDWLNSRMQQLPRKALLNVIKTSDHIIPLKELISTKRIILSIDAGTKASVLKQLIAPLIDSGTIADPDQYLQHLMAREDVVSTAIAPDIAIPHVREPEKFHVSEPCIVLGVCKEGTEFDSLDGRKTYVFAMPCTNAESNHLQLMAKISMLFRTPGTIEGIKSAETKEDIMQLLAETDAVIQTRP